MQFMMLIANSKTEGKKLEVFKYKTGLKNSKIQNFTSRAETSYTTAVLTTTSANKSTEKKTISVYVVCSAYQ